MANGPEWNPLEVRLPLSQEVVQALRTVVRLTGVQGVDHVVEGAALGLVPPYAIAIVYVINAETRRRRDRRRRQKSVEARSPPPPFSSPPTSASPRLSGC